MHKILLIEDDVNLGISISLYLKNEGFDVSWLKTLNEARKANLENFQVLILDWMLPDGQGIDFLKEMREKKISLPVIMLTARNELIDKVVGLESGANDYVTKPFEPRELVARLRVQLRLPQASLSDEGKKIQLKDLLIDCESRNVTWRNSPVILTKMEYDLLLLFAERPGRAFSREEILNKVWGFENYPTTRTVDTHVLQLRQKFADDLIETVRGIGYKLNSFYQELTNG